MNQRRGNWFTEHECHQLMSGIMRALEYIHSKNIVHRDLKPENILVADPNDMSSIRLSDFGLSIKLSSTLSKQCGTQIYMAPELLDGKVYSKPVDIWSAGVIFYMLLHQGKHPYFSPGDTSILMRENIKHIHDHPFR
jgi:serine/threonine protein kinase